MKSTPNAAERLSLLSTKLSVQPHSSALLEWAELMLEQGKAKDAAQKLASAQAKYASSYRFHVILARVHRALGNTAKAKEAYEKACALAPQNEVALRELIMLELPIKSVAKSTPAPASRPFEKPVAEKPATPQQAVIEDAVAKSLDSFKFKKPEPPPLPMQVAVEPISAEEFLKEMNTDIIDDLNDLVPKVVSTVDKSATQAAPHDDTIAPSLDMMQRNMPALNDTKDPQLLDLPKELASPLPYPVIEEQVNAIRSDEPDAIGAIEMAMQNAQPPLTKRDEVPVFEEVKVLQPEGTVQLDKEKLAKVLSKLSISPPSAEPKPNPAPAFTDELSKDSSTGFADAQIEELAAALSNVKMSPVEEMSDPTPIQEQRQPVSDEEDIKFPTRNLAEIFVAQGAFAKAIKVYEKLAEKEPQNAVLFGIIINGLRAQLK